MAFAVYQSGLLACGQCQADAIAWGTNFLVSHCQSKGDAIQIMNDRLQTHLECVIHCKVLLKKNYQYLLMKVVIFLCETGGSLKQQTVGEIYWGDV